MNNITYTIIDKISNNDDSGADHKEVVTSITPDICENIDIETQSKKCKYSTDDIEQKLSENVARAVDYELNYNIKYLTNILDFYEIKRQKLNKKELVRKIVDFETDSNNEKQVQQRHRLFANFIELKNDKFFCKYIMGGL